MATISEKLQLALDNKAKIKAAIEEKGGTITGDMSTWGDSIKEIKTGGALDPIKCTYNVTTTSSVTKIVNEANWMTFGVANFKINGVEKSLVSSFKFTSLGNNDVEFRSATIISTAFRYCTSLTSIIVPDTITSIGSSAFSDCSNLTSITLSESVTRIGTEAFSDCTNLTSVNIHNGLQFIGSSAFSRCSKLTSITIPNSVTTIGDYAFYDCTSLINVTISDSVTSISTSAFSYCTSLTSITIPDSVTSIGDNAFCDCSSLTSVTIPDSVTSIDYNAFFGIPSQGNLYFTTKSGATPSDMLLDNFIGWELYINGEHIGTIIPEAGGYYYTEEKHDFYAGDGYNGTFFNSISALGMELCFWDVNPFYGKSVLSVKSNIGEETILDIYISESNRAVITLDGILERKWIDVTLG